jgi:formylmethanofuran dehydrogenase subunit E
MNAQEILSGEDFKKCADFHGHICPGLSIGYRASKAGLEWLKENRSEDEEIVAIVETDACCADAVQVLTGCTFGKGNFIYKDHGKNVFTFLSRDSGKGVRVALKDGTMRLTDEHFELIGKIRNETASEEERKRFQEIHLQKSCDVLEKPLEELFSIRETTVQLPEKAQIQPSKPCDRCGEPAMASKLKEKNGLYVCGDCLNA